MWYTDPPPNSQCNTHTIHNTHVPYVRQTFSSVTPTHTYASSLRARKSNIHHNQRIYIIANIANAHTTEQHKQIIHSYYTIIHSAFCRHLMCSNYYNNCIIHRCITPNVFEHLDKTKTQTARANKHCSHAVLAKISI